MPKFNITINPALRTPEGSTQIVITSVLKRAKVECSLDDLPAEMIKAATGVVSREDGAPLLNVYASLDGRSFKAFKAFEAANKNTMLIDPAATTVPETETADAAA